MPDPGHGFGPDSGPMPGGMMPEGPVPGAPVPGVPGDGSDPSLEWFRGGPGDAPAGPTAGPGLGSSPAGGPGGPDAPRWPGPGLDTPSLVPTPGLAAAPAARRPAPAQAKPAPAKKKGRSKVVLIGGAVIVLFGVAYGAGLLLNHSDVPKGTTVLGVDISGSRDEAVTKLQTAFGTRAAAPLQVSVGGKQAELKPDKAGLGLDAQTTVRNAAGSDYNPVTVIGSLLGNERVADPVMPVDEEKLRVALQELAGTSGTASEATIKFDTGKAVAVPGQPGSTLDVDASVPIVSKAFRDMVETGKSAAPELPVTTKAPTIDQAEIDRAMKEFAEPAMSANAIVKIGNKPIAFGAKSLPKILSMQPVDGHLVEKYDLDALKATYGNTWDGVLITRGTGEKTPVTPQDVAGALTKALRGKTTAERTVVVDTNPS
ncbi:peptidoglycan binding domain-containing protein [Streptomyces sp. NPDC056367]